MTPANRVIYLEDRSGAETDDQCGMKYWWNRKEGGKGLVPAQEEFALMVGRETHNDLAAVANMEDISPESIQLVINELTSALTEEDKNDQKKMEILYRRLGWLAGFALYVEPTIRATYDNVGVEDELILAREPLWVPFTPDRILRNRLTGRLEYREYKTTISSNQKWMQSWAFAIQLHIALAGINEELDEKCHFAQIMGLMKGYQSSSDHRWVHPYVWGYYNASSSKWSCEYQRGNDWVPMPVWEYPGGVVKWVQFCGEEIARTQFPHSPPVFLDERMLSGWIRRRLHRQQQINCIEQICQENPVSRGNWFEMRTSRCRPGFGDQCPYLKLCWNAEDNANPMRSGDYIVREPHHDVEIIGVEGL